MNTRPYQDKAVHDIRVAFSRGFRRVCFVMPTAAGKTVVATTIILSAIARSRRVVFLAHRKELIEQTVAKLIACGLAMDQIRVIRAQHGWGSPDAPVVVASVPTLAGARWDADKPPADLVILDECHHINAASFDRVVASWPAAHVLGLTATPCRADDRPLGDVFDALVLGPSIRWLIDNGYLVPIRVVAPSHRLDTSKIAQSPRDAYAEYGNNQPCVVFCRDVAHAEAEAAILGWPVVHGKVRDRGVILEAFANGEHRGLVSVGVLTEGWDAPIATVAILARAVNHIGLYLQIAGRILRTHPGKQQATLIDLHGSLWDPGIGLPDAERTWSLDGKGAPPLYRMALRQCRHCGAVYEHADVCPWCHTPAPAWELAAPKVTGDKLTVASSQPRVATIWYETIVAKFPGRCQACLAWFPAGERIVWAKGYARHVVCPVAKETTT